LIVPRDAVEVPERHQDVAEAAAADLLHPAPVHPVPGAGGAELGRGGRRGALVTPAAGPHGPLCGQAQGFIRAEGSQL